MTLHGYTGPLSPDGKAGLVPPPPWHYSGDLMIIEYRTDPAGVEALLPPELEPGEDPGAVAAIFADWQSCSDDRHELLDPIRSQYREFYLVVSCRYQGKPATRCVYIWVDKDFAMFRGWIQGFPKKLGSIHMTRAFNVGKAAPRIEAGAQFGATCASGDRQVARALLTLREVSKTGPVVADPPIYNSRIFPAATGLVPDIYELVKVGGYDREIGEIWEGDAELTFFPDAVEDIMAIAPKTILKGYRYSFAYSVIRTEVLAQHEKEGLL